MDFLWPLGLWGLPLLAVLPFVYVWLLRRRKQALKFSNLDLVRAAVAGRASVRRHLPPALFFVALALMAFALTRPTAIVTLPSERATVILAIDISGSMRAQDVEPSRMAAAQAAARTFVSEQPREVRIGLVAFSGNAMLAQAPTLLHQDVIDALDRLHPQRYTAVGSGIVASLQAIFPEMELGQSLATLEERGSAGAPLGQRPPQPPKPGPAPVPPGSYTSAAIVLLSDGRTNAGVPPLDAAHIAADLGVRVFTIGFGSAEGSIADLGYGYGMRMQPDEETLKAISEITKAAHYNAKSADELKNVYKTLSTQFVAETKRTELTAMIAAPALLMLVLAGTLSLLWSNRMT